MAGRRKVKFNGDLLVEKREGKLLTQEQLAELAGVSPGTISRLENERNEARFSTIGKIAKGLGIDPQELVEPDPPRANGKAA